MEKDLAQQLLLKSTAEPLATAVVLSSGPVTDEKNFDLAKTALSRYQELRNPGLDARGFYRMQTFVLSNLSGAVGEGYFAKKKFDDALPFLQRAVETDQNNARFVYTLARTYLSKHDPDKKQGYWYLTRAVTLTQGMPQSRQIDAYARSSYISEGGTSADWDRFLAAATPPGQNAPMIASKSAPPVSVSETKSPARPNSAQTSASTRAASPRPESPSSERADEEKMAELKRRIDQPPVTDTSSSTAPASAKPPARAGAPVSIGVLIEADMAEGSSRRAVVNGLSDMVRHLRRNDEAFILSFGRDMVMEEDLTSNSDLLEKAMDDIRGGSGTTLYDAVAFSAGHLARIARNSNRALLVISDGSASASTVSSLQVSGAIQQSGVKIYCIGVEVASTEDQQRLIALAHNSGGRATFVSSPGQFRTATQTIASQLGVPF